MIKIFTDSTSYITKEYAMKEDVTVVPLNYVFEDQAYKEGFSGEFEDYFTKLENSKSFPTTSQPSAGDFYNLFEETLKDNNEIIAILISSKLSGTYNSAILAKEMLGDKRITIIDSLTAASNLRYLVEDAVEMVKEGKTSKEIETYINNKKNNTNIYLVPDTLEYLKRGGRLSSAQMIVGNLLGIKPIIGLFDGELKSIEKVRGKRKAFASMIDKIPQEIKRISICHILYLEEAEKLKSELESKFPDSIITIDDLGPVVGSHLGPKTIGICLY